LSRTPLPEIARVFFKLGATSFGGPAAHIAIMEDEVVRRRRWITRESFLDYIGATNLIPGPNSTELAIHIGLARGGWPGLIVAGAAFILPAALIVALIAWAYVRFGALPGVQGLLGGVKPVVIAVVVQALWRLARSAVRDAGLAAIAAVAIVATALGGHELLVLAGGALAAVVVALRPRAGPPVLVGATSISAGSMARPAAAAVLAGSAVAAPFALPALFGVFLKVGAVLFGSGYVLLAFLRADLVSRLHWLTERQLLDAVAVGQVTPGPVFTTATFVGYLLGGAPGAAVATAGIFLPAFVFVAASGPVLPRLRRSRVAGAALDGVNVASLALMAVVTWQLGRAALMSPLSWVLAGLSALLLLRFRINSALLVAGGALAGLLIGR
jgi:chromate transporter